MSAQLVLSLKVKSIQLTQTLVQNVVHVLLFVLMKLLLFLSKKILFSYIKRKKAFFLERFFCFMLMCSCWCNYLSRPCGKKNKIAGGNSIMNMM